MQVPFVPAAANFLMANAATVCAVFQKLYDGEIMCSPLKGYGLY